MEVWDASARRVDLISHNVQLVPQYPKLATQQRCPGFGTVASQYRPSCSRFSIHRPVSFLRGVTRTRSIWRYVVKVVYDNMRLGLSSQWSLTHRSRAPRSSTLSLSVGVWSSHEVLSIHWHQKGPSCSLTLVAILLLLHVADIFSTLRRFAD